MKNLCLAAAFAAAVSAAGAAAFSPTLNVTADRIAGDRGGERLVATGSVDAVSRPTRLLSEFLERHDDKSLYFSDPTTVTTCTNELGHLHWSVKSEVEYRDGESVILKNAVLRFWEIPVFWLPYWYHPLDGANGYRMMAGYTSRWGAYMMNKYLWHVAGDRRHEPGTYWATASTRLDLRSENGIAFGQSFDWSVGDYGCGHFKMYYAWDNDHDRYETDWNSDEYNYRNWSSEIPYGRYTVELEHRWDVTERDILRIRGAVYSDSYVRKDFFRRSFFNLKNQFNGYDGNELAWEHNENAFGTGISVSGPLNDFYSGVSRLPEFYIDVAPTPVWKLPVNYESQTHAGYLIRQAGEHGNGESDSAYRYVPGEWADYRTFRLDTYHRLTAPFKVADLLAVAPRLAYRGTYWNNAGYDNVTGWGGSGRSDDSMFRSIVEAGVTFSGRGTAWISDVWQHVLEPYADVLAQEAWYAGDGDGKRPYVFDSTDASVDWEDQFAGRSRNLPYSYYGVTPGIRNAFRQADDKGRLRTVADIDVYAALQFNRADWTAGDEGHRLAEVGRPNYGENSCTVVPGVRARWHPTSATVLSGRLEYDAENNRIAIGDLSWHHRLSDRFKYYGSVMSRDYRMWDFSTTPYDPTTMTTDDFNRMHYCYVEAGFEHEICDALAWGPYIRWDCRENDLDSVGTWFDIRTDCLGFRFIVSYDNEYERIDGSSYEEDWSVGFYIYLRAFGADSGSLFN